MQKIFPQDIKRKIVKEKKYTSFPVSWRDPHSDTSEAAVDRNFIMANLSQDFKIHAKETLTLQEQLPQG